MVNIGPGEGPQRLQTSVHLTWGKTGLSWPNKPSLCTSRQFITHMFSGSNRPQGSTSQPLSNLCSALLRAHVPVHVVYVVAAEKTLKLWHSSYLSWTQSSWKKKKKRFECLPRQKVMVKSLILRFTQRFIIGYVLHLLARDRRNWKSFKDFPGLILVWRKAKRHCNGLDGSSNPTCVFSSRWVKSSSYTWRLLENLWTIT